jgi:hypothetical protein
VVLTNATLFESVELNKPTRRHGFDPSAVDVGPT